MVEVLAWTAFFLFALLVLALRFWLLPDIERYREAIVARATEAVGQPVKIAGIEAGWLGLRPQISLTDVRIYDAGGREVLALPLVENVVSWRSLVFRDLRLHSLLIDGPRLTVRRDAEGGLHIAGMKLSRDSQDPRFTDWLLGQSEIVVRNAEIEWRDEKRGAPPLALTSLTLRIRNEGDAHALGLNARPPAELGSTLDVRATLAGRTVTDISAWSGRVYAELGDTDLAAWRAWFDYPIDLRRGRGAVRLWATLADGEARRATADVALADVDARLGKDLAPLELESVRGRLSAKSDEQGYELFARGLVLAVPQGPKWPETDFQISWKHARGSTAEAGSVAGKLIEFEPLAQLAGSLPLPAEVRKLIAELEPRGQLADTLFDWSGPLAEPERYRARARFADLALRPWRSMPGFSGLAGSFEATQSAGRLNLTARNAVISLPRVFPEPDVRFDTLSGGLEWERTSERGFAVRVSAMNFANADLAGQASGSYANDGAGPGKVDLTASLTRADGRQVARYLPHAELMGPRTRSWLASSILDGQASDASIRLRGDLADFPFRDPASGQFLVTARVKNGVLSYGSDWPAINEVEAELRFERERMEIAGRSGTIFGAKLANVRIAMADLKAPAPVLTIAGQADGPTSEFLRFVEASPVKRMAGHMTNTLVATGNGRLRIRIDIPLAELSATRVAGEYELNGNNVTVHPQLPAVERASGKVAFTDSGFTVQDVRGRLFGGTVVISGGSVGRSGASPAVEVLARGDATLAALGGLFEHPWKRYLSGAAPYTATVNIAEGLHRITVESSLRGVASALPPPLEKAAADTLPLRVEVYPAEAGGRERISVALGRLAAAEFLRQGQGSAQRLSIALSPRGETMRIPERPGTLVYGSLGALDLDRWAPLFPSAGESGAPATLFELQLGTLDVYGKRIRNVSMKAGADAGGWSAALGAEELAGDLSYRSENGGRLVARLAHFTMPDDTPQAVHKPKGQQPRELPALDLVAERFALRGKQLGRVEVRAMRAGDDWRIEKLAMTNPDSTLSARGVWTAAVAPSATARCALEFQLETSDTGKFLARIGHPDLVRGGKANVEGSVSWSGEPATIDYPTLSGKLKLEAQEGQFLEIDPGAGKLVSLMSLQSLPRRITLDFSDVFSKGFQFDRINASAEVQRGVMAISDFQMRGSAAEVQMSGTADLAHETQDLKVRVVPSLGDSAATVVGILNPVIGGAAWFAQRVLKNPLGQLFSYNYSITGSWGDPKVVKIAPEASLPEAAKP